MAKEAFQEEASLTALSPQVASNKEFTNCPKQSSHNLKRWKNFKCCVLQSQYQSNIKNGWKVCAQKGGENRKLCGRNRKKGKNGVGWIARPARFQPRLGNWIEDNEGGAGFIASKSSWSKSSTFSWVNRALFSSHYAINALSNICWATEVGLATLSIGTAWWEWEDD